MTTGSVILDIAIAIIAPFVWIAFFLGIFFFVFSTRMGTRIYNFVVGIFLIFGMKGPGFLGFYRPGDLLHILFDIGILCGYLAGAFSIYRGFVLEPRQKQTNPELAATYK